MEDRSEASSLFERHVQTAIGVVITALLLWVGSSVTQLQQSVARQDERLASLQGAVGTLQNMQQQVSELRDRVTTLEAERRYRAGERKSGDVITR